MSVGGNWTQKRDRRKGGIRFRHDVLLDLGVRGSGVVVVMAHRTWPSQVCNHFSTWRQLYAPVIYPTKLCFFSPEFAATEVLYALLNTYSRWRGESVYFSAQSGIGPALRRTIRGATPAEECDAPYFVNITTRKSAMFLLHLSTINVTGYHKRLPHIRYPGRAGIALGVDL